MKRIGVLSDTHIRSDLAAHIPPRLLQAWGHVDLILHAGDITSPALLQTLNRIANTSAIVGNNDGTAILATCPHSLVLDIEQCQLGLIHGDEILKQLLSEKGLSLRQLGLVRFHQALRSHFPTTRCIVYGHTHHAVCSRDNGVLFFNPGACSWRDGNLIGSVGLLTVNGACVSGEIICF